MARPTTIRGSKILIQLEASTDSPPDSPFAYIAPCALTTKGIDFTAETNDFNVPDCDDPDAPTWTERVVNALSAGVNGAGTLAMESLDEWRDWFLSGEEKNIRVKIDTTLAEGGGYFQLNSVLTGFNLGGNHGELATIEVVIASNGEVTWVPAAA